MRVPTLSTYRVNKYAHGVWSLNEPISDSLQTLQSLFPLTMSRAVVVLCFVLFAGYVVGNLIRNDDVTTKDVKIPHDDISSPNDDTNREEAFVEQEKNDVETPAEVFGTDPPKCQKIGQFCTNHGDCCTNACLGYLKKCVTASGQ